MKSFLIALLMSTLPQAAPAEGTVPAGTEIFAEIGRSFDLKRAAPQDPFYVTVNVPVSVNDTILIPVGSQFIGRIVLEEGRNKREVGLALNRLILPDGRTYVLDGDMTSRDREASAKVDRDSIPSSMCSIVDMGANSLFKLFEKKKDILPKGATLTLRLNSDLAVAAPAS